MVTLQAQGGGVGQGKGGVAGWQGCGVRQVKGQGCCREMSGVDESGKGGGGVWVGSAYTERSR